MEIVLTYYYVHVPPAVMRKLSDWLDPDSDD